MGWHLSLREGMWGRCGGWGDAWRVEFEYKYKGGVAKPSIAPLEGVTASRDKT